MVTAIYHLTCLISYYMSIEIIPATPADIPALVKLVNSAYRGEGSKAGWTTEADLLDGIRTDEEDLAGLLGKEENTILKATENDGIIGCVYLQKKDTAMYLGMLTVNPQLQAKGIGRQLMTAAEGYARRQQCTSMEMTVITVRHELIAWYNKHGYHATGATKPFPTGVKIGVPKQPIEFMVMSKRLV